MPDRIALPLCWRPIWTVSNVTGLVPNALDRRMRACLPQMSGRTIRRKDWSVAPFAASGKAKRSSGCAVALPTGYGPWAEAVQATTKFGGAAMPEVARVSDAARIRPARMRRAIVNMEVGFPWVSLDAGSGTVALGPCGDKGGLLSQK